jgi:glycosyltransferase involved in cell wall biosynthesis
VGQDVRGPGAEGARTGGNGIAARGTRRSITVVIPAKNEARNIGWVIGRISPTIDEVVLVDGRSTDGTVDVALALWPGLVVVRDDRPGKGAALRAGFEAATGDYVVMIDADGSMDPLEIPRFVSLLDAGHDLVKGSRFMPGGGTADMTLLRAAGNWSLLQLANVLLGTSFTELCYGYAAFRREAILALELTATGFEIETQLFLRAIRSGLRVAEVPSFEAPRRSGTSNLHTFRDGRRVLRTILEERLRRSASEVRLEHGLAESLEAFSFDAETIASSLALARQRLPTERAE